LFELSVRGNLSQEAGSIVAAIIVMAAKLQCRDV